MARLSRVYQKLFGSAANAGEIGKFGSLAAGSPTTTTDPAVMQALGNWDGGWFSAVLGGNSPAIEDMNSLHYVAFYQLAYLFQSGVPEWNSSTTYYVGGLAQDGYGNIYVSLADNNTGNALTNLSYWVSYTNLATPVGSVQMYAGNPGSAPLGFLYCDGSSLSTTTYARLFSIIGYSFGGSGGSFNLPNTRGIFVRGVGTQTIGSVTYTGAYAFRQNDQFPAHDHGGGNHRHRVSGTSGPANADSGSNRSGAYYVDTDYSGTIIATNGVGTETQPANISLNYIIKF